MALLWREKSRSSFQKKVIADVIVALAYTIWWARNKAVWNYTAWKPDKVVQRMKRLVL